MKQAMERLWTKDFIMISITNFFLYFVFYLLVVTMTVYAVEQYAVSASQAGLVTGIFIIGILIGRLFIGRLIAITGNKKMLFAGLFFFTMTSLLYFIDSNILFLLLTRFLQGIAFGVASTATGTIVAEIIPGSRKGEGISYYSMSITIATALGPFIGLYMSERTSYELIFAFCTVLAITSLMIALFVTIPAKKEANQPTTKERLRLSSFIEPKALPIALIIIIVSLGYSGVLSFINFYAVEIDLLPVASLFFVVYAVFILLSRPFAGRLMDVKGANVVMYPAFILFTAGLLVLSVVTSSWLFLLAGAFIGLGFGNMQSTTQAIAIKSVSHERIGLATSTYYIALDVGLGFGPYVLGFIIPLTGYSHLYLWLAVMVLLTTGLYYFLHGKRKRLTER